MTSLLIALSVFLSMCFFYKAFHKRGNHPELLLQARLGRHLNPGGDQNTGSPVLNRRGPYSDIPFFNRFLRAFRLVQALTDLIRQSGTEISTGTFLLLAALWQLVSFLSCHMAGFPIAATIGFMMLGFFSPLAVFAVKRAKRRKVFSLALPQVLGCMSSSLRTGYSLQMALESVIEESDTIIAQEFKKVLAEVEVGQGFEVALERMLERIDTPELRLFIASVKIQRESGGNLAELLDHLEAAMRDRFELKRELQAATAQAKLSGMVLSGLPFFVGIFIHFVNPGYIGFFLNDPVGKGLFWLCIGGQLIGILVIQKIVNIRM